MPAVRRPEGHVPFRRKLLWTGLILVLYFFLTNVDIYGLSQTQQNSDLFGQFRSILAGSQGSVLQLGIGPIVTASIVLQLLGGANLLGLDTDDPRDQILYQGLQKLLVAVMIVLTGLPMVFGGGFLPASSQVAGSLGIGLSGVRTLMFAQIFVGGLLILFMDEIVSKWGVGSGIGLFIIAGISQRLIAGVASLSLSWYGIVTGSVQIGAGIESLIQSLLIGQGRIIALVTTVAIFAIVVYAESVRVEIPLSHARVKGARGRFPVKLIYASI
ncbi:preprotein translocase subunit SecY, partial [Halobacteriales archaeon SW_7_68_16]